MSTAAVTDRGAAPGVRRRPPDVVVALLVYALSRAWAAVVIVRAARHQLPSVWTGEHSGYLDMAQLWDAQWYRIIAVTGYPVPLPVDDLGAVQQNAWAFFPAFPYAVKAVMAVTGLQFAPAAVLLNLLLGGLAVVVLLHLMQRVAGRGPGLAAVVLLCTFPAAPALQIGYSEALALLVLALAFWWLLGRRYLLAGAAVLVLALTRPVVAPFALAVLAHLVVRWRARGRDPFPVRERAQVVALGLFAAASTLLWPLVVGLVTGEPSAFARTQGAWRTGGTVKPFEQSVGIAHLLLGAHALWWVLVAAVAFTALVLSPWGRRVGAELQTWCLAYPAYLLAVTEPWTSTFRYLLLMFPLGAVVAGAVRWRWLVPALALAGLALQVRWVDELLVFVPPTDFPP